MSQFMMMIKGDPKQWNGHSPERVDEIMKLYNQWTKDLVAKNVFKGGDGLKDGTWTIKKDADSLVVDGPFTESKESLTGYYMLEAENIDQAVEIAKGCPALTHGEFLEIVELGH